MSALTIQNEQMNPHLSQFVFGERFFRSPSVVDVDGDADESETQDALRHGPRDVVPCGGCSQIS